MSFPENPLLPHIALAGFRPARHNAMFARDGRCLAFASYSQTLRDCGACQTITWCPYYDRQGERESDRLAVARWEDDGGSPWLPR